jgi:hypothetical protein
LCLGLGFERLITLDILLYGASLALEFAALVALRITEPGLSRPFQVPGGLLGAIALGIPPLALLCFAVIQSEEERIWGLNALLFGLAILLLGFVLYALCSKLDFRVGQQPE